MAKSVRNGEKKLKLDTIRNVVLLFNICFTNFKPNMFCNCNRNNNDFTHSNTPPLCGYGVCQFNVFFYLFVIIAIGFFIFRRTASVKGQRYGQNLIQERLLLRRWRPISDIVMDSLRKGQFQTFFI